MHVRFDELATSHPADVGGICEFGGQRGVAEWLLDELPGALKDGGVKLRSLKQSFHPDYDRCAASNVAGFRVLGYRVCYELLELNADMIW